MNQMSKRVQLTLPESSFPSILLKIERVFNKFQKVNLHGVPTIIQYYECSPPVDPEYNGLIVTLRGELVVYSEYSVELERYHKDCYKQGCRVVGQDTDVKDWLAGLAVKTRAADQGTKRVRVDKSDHVLGLFVMPVFLKRGHNQTVGIIELVTIAPKGSYVSDFIQIHKLRKDEGLDSKGMAKTIKVRFKGEIMIKFMFSISAEFKDLQMELKDKLKIPKHKRYIIEYEDINGNSLQIVSDADPKVCIKESVSKESTVIRMSVKLAT